MLNCYQNCALTNDFKLYHAPPYIIKLSIDKDATAMPSYYIFLKRQLFWLKL